MKGYADIVGIFNGNRNGFWVMNYFDAFYIVFIFCIAAVAFYATHFLCCKMNGGGVKRWI